MARMGRNVLEFDNPDDGVPFGLPSSPTYLVSIVKYLNDNNLLLFLALRFLFICSNYIIFCDL
jgi:hypothetical protein